jgi:hypothetical protein
MEAPRERPRARKKVIRAPAVSQSLERTNLRERQREIEIETDSERKYICIAYRKLINGFISYSTTALSKLTEL